MAVVDDAVWTALDAVPPDLLSLAGRCLAADGGLPLLTDPAFLAGRWGAPFGLRAAASAFGGGASAPRGDGALLAAGAVRATAGGATFCGLVDPAARGRGIGGSLLDRGLAETNRVGAAHADPVIVVEAESLTDEADALFASRKLRQVFAEDVMHIDLGAQALPLPAWPAGTGLAEWSGETARRFHAV